MGPITLGLGLINVNLAIAVWFADRDVLDVGELTDYWPAAIDKAFRIYMLPQGMFSVAVAAVLFPTLARLATAGELRPSGASSPTASARSSGCSCRPP
jgi:putative peptidoglycan lipid II flippase